MNKTVIKIFLVLFLIIVFGPEVQANTDGYRKDQLEASGASELSEYLEKGTLDYLEKLGCEEPDFEKLMNVSAESVFELIYSMIKSGISEPLKGLLKSVGAVLMISVASAFFPDDPKSRSLLNLIGGCFLIIGVFAPSIQSVQAVSSAIKACAAFEKALIPVLAAILTVSGNPTLALSVKGTAFAAAQFIEHLAESFVLPLIGISSSLGIAGSILPTLRLSAVSDIIRKTMTVVLSCATGLFVAFLGMKSLLSSGADSLAVKGIKMASSTFVPVIGGALGDVYTSVTGSLSLLKSTVGIYGVAAVLMICAPVVINLALWALSMKAAAAISGLLDCQQSSELLKNIGFVFSMLNTVLLLCMAVFVISAGITVLIKNGG